MESKLSQKGIIFLGLFFTCKALAGINTPLQRHGLNGSELKTGLATSYYRTARNFDGNGRRVGIGEQSSFEEISGIWFLMLGVSRDFTVFSDLEYSYNRAVQNDLSKSARGPGDADVGIHYEPKVIPFPLMFDAFFQFPMYPRLSAQEWATFNANSPVPLGQGTTEMQVLASAEIPIFKSFNLGLSGGYAILSSGFSSYVPYRAYIQYEETRHLFVRFGASGQVSTETDAYNTMAHANERSSQAAAGSKRYNSVNPTFLNADATFGYYVSPFLFLNAGVQSEILGRNSSQGLLLMAAIGVHLGSVLPPAEGSVEE